MEFDGEFSTNGEVSLARGSVDMENPSEMVGQYAESRDSGAFPGLGRDWAILREALAGLRQEIRSRQDRHWSADSQERFDWLGAFDSLRRVVGKLGMSERAPSVDDFGFDPQALEQVDPLLEFLHERYFRVETHVPVACDIEGPVLFVSNRSGALPWDAVMLSYVLERQFPECKRPRFLVDDTVLGIPFARSGLARLGGIRACRENLDQLLARGHSVVSFPEGARGAARRFQDRYRLGRFGRGGVIRAALENAVPLIPVGIVGGEEIYPLLYRAEAWGALFGLPFVPITPTFPLLGPLGAIPLPAKWVITVGQPLDLEAYDFDDGVDELAMFKFGEGLRDQVQDLVDQGLDARSSG